MGRLLTTRWLAFTLALATLALVPGQARAGCLSEYKTCSDCAKKSLRRAMLRFDPVGVIDANVELWDCSIDLNHCIFFGQHHEYGCAR